MVYNAGPPTADHEAPRETARIAAYAAPVERWRSVAQEMGFVDFVVPDDRFRACEGQQGWADARQPGIYFWLAENGEAYIGQSVSPRSRLRQHMKVHGDIVRAAFRRCSRADLDALEAELVRRASDHFPLRNIKLALSTATQVPFDLVVMPEEQKAFLEGAELPTGEWRPLEQLQRLQERRFDEFLKLEGAATALAALQLYVARVVPRPAATEAAFWSVTVQPQQHMLRVNAGQQEVFTAELSRSGTITRVLTAERVRWIGSWRLPYQTRSFENVVRSAQLDAWLRRNPLISSRRLVVQLMRHTQALNSGSHCPQVLRSR